MQELLARLKALDPNASLALRIIACFDELVRGGVNIHGLLGAAASLSGCVAGYAGHESARTLRVSPGGEVLKDGGVEKRVGALEADGMTVWLERDGPARVNDRMILERLALALAIRSGHTAEDPLRRLGDLLDANVDVEQRRAAAANSPAAASSTNRSTDWYRPPARAPDRPTSSSARASKEKGGVPVKPSRLHASE